MCDRRSRYNLVVWRLFVYTRCRYTIGPRIENHMTRSGERLQTRLSTVDPVLSPFPDGLRLRPTNLQPYLGKLDTHTLQYQGFRHRHRLPELRIDHLETIWDDLDRSVILMIVDDFWLMVKVSLRQPCPIWSRLKSKKACGVRFRKSRLAAFLLVRRYVGYFLETTSRRFRTHLEEGDLDFFFGVSNVDRSNFSTRLEKILESAIWAYQLKPAPYIKCQCIFS